MRMRLVSKAGRGTYIRPSETDLLLATLSRTINYDQLAKSFAPQVCIWLPVRRLQLATARQCVPENYMGVEVALRGTWNAVPM